MPDLACSGKLAEMSRSATPTRLHLEVHFTQPIKGRLYGRRGESAVDRPFTGWLSLMSAIEAASAGPARDERAEGEAR